MARSACLHAAGTCRARLDRCLDPPFARAHTEGGTRGTRCAFHRGGTDEPDRDDQRNQWLETHRGGLLLGCSTAVPTSSICTPPKPSRRAIVNNAFICPPHGTKRLSSRRGNVPRSAGPMP